MTEKIKGKTIKKGIEIVYNKTTGRITAWNMDENQQGNLRPKEGQELVVWDTEVPDGKTDSYFADVKNKKIKLNPDYVPPAPARDLAVEIDEIKEDVEGIKEILEA